MDNFKYSFLLWVALYLLLLVSFGFAYFYLSQNYETSVSVVIKKEEASSSRQVVQFNPAMLSWSQATSSAAWQSRDSAASFVFGNKMWIIGGLNGNGHVDEAGIVQYWEAPHFNDIWSTTDGSTWKLEAAHAEFPPRRSMSVVEFRGKLWMFGGYSPTGGLQSDIWQSDDGVHWRQVSKKAAFIPREGQSIEVFHDRLWMIGGANYDLRTALHDVWYSDDGLDWVLATSSAPWSPRWDHDTEVFNGKMYLVSGMDLTLATFNDVWVTDDGFTWNLVTAHAPWEGRQGDQLITFHNLLWIIGRLNDVADSNGPNDIWYSADGVTWQKTDADPPWTGREDHAVLIFNDRIYLFAGMDSSWRWRNDVWFSSN